MAPPLPEVVVDLARLPLLAVLLQLAVLAQVPFLAQPQVEAELAVEAVSVEAPHHHRSFSSAMAGS